MITCVDDADVFFGAEPWYTTMLRSLAFTMAGPKGFFCEQLMRERKGVFPMRKKEHHQPISQAPFSLESFAVVSWGIFHGYVK